jgi:hypothetical protein
MRIAGGTNSSVATTKNRMKEKTAPNGLSVIHAKADEIQDRMCPRNSKS